MKIQQRLPFLFSVACLFVFQSCSEKPKRLLIFTKTNGFRHESIPVGIQSIANICQLEGVSVDTTEDATQFQDDILSRYHAVVFLNTSGDVLDARQQVALKRFIEAGGGFLGIHAAADTEQEWFWYTRLVGAVFKNHPAIQKARMKSDGVPPTFNFETDEWYNFHSLSDDLIVLDYLDESSYVGGENGKAHPIIWYHDYCGGRSFYIGLGHTGEIHNQKFFQDRLAQGIRYVVGSGAPDYGKATSNLYTESNRYSKRILDFNLDEPTEMTILPDGRIIFMERKGKIKLYDPTSGNKKEILRLNTFTGHEDGLLGLTADPNFATNAFIYIYYAHPERSENVVSRFVVEKDTINPKSEVEILSVETQRTECCHTGGSMAFGPDGCLYISTGDNTNPSQSQGFGPTDEQTGRSSFDAQRSSANNNDLRGKILRIRPQSNGTYQIPEGNLFVGDSLARPEIYVMGCRNPYRISVDEISGALFWGDVGPDAFSDDPLRGPRGYDEINRTMSAGFFGWPYFIGNNYPYTKYDFSSDKSGENFNASRPENHSPNNTGHQILPSAQAPLIWYPYNRSETYPILGEGSRNAMAGPVYHRRRYSATTAFPEFVDGKLIIYDWMRNKLFLVSMDNKGKLLDIEPFLENLSFHNLIDMAIGKDGKLYTLEYGSQWYSQNLDARLSRIDFNPGNRPPSASLQTNRTAGKIPFKIELDATKSFDYDGDSLSYQLKIGDQRMRNNSGKFSVTLNVPGVYKPEVTVTDLHGATGTATTVVTAGNEPPNVLIEITHGNDSFFFKNTPIKYNVVVTDQEDGSTIAGSIRNFDVPVTFEWMDGLDMSVINVGHKIQEVALPGKTLIQQNDCLACHQEEVTSAGPSWENIALRYSATDKKISKQLVNKIIQGGSGNWGERQMAAHPDITQEDAAKMIDYIMTLDKKKQPTKLNRQGTVRPGTETNGAYVLKASYRDKPVAGVPSQSVSVTHVLRAPHLVVSDASHIANARKMTGVDGIAYLDDVSDNSYVVFKNIDLTGIREIIPAAFRFGDIAGGIIELHIDGVNGQLLGTLDFQSARKTTIKPQVDETIQAVPIPAIASTHDLFVVFKNPRAQGRKLFYFTGLHFIN